RCADVLRIEHVFHRDGVGPVACDQFGERFVDVAQPGGERVARARADHAAFDEREVVGAIVRPHNAVPGGGGAGIDAEDDQPALAISPTSISKFAQTFWTSSSSSIASSS